MSLLPPLPIMERWRLEGLSPQEVRARADTWIKEAQQALKRPVQQPPRPKPKPMPTLGSVTGLKPGPKPGIPRRFPPRPKDGRSKPPRQGRPINRKLPDLETLVALYQTHTIQEIAGIYKVSPESVGRQLKKVNAVAAKRLARKQALEQEKAQRKQGHSNLKLPDQAHLEELYKTHTLKEIGAMYEASTEAVAHHLRKTGAIERKRKNKEAADLAQIRVMRAQGMSWDRMAKTLHRSAEHLRKLAEGAGMETSFRILLVCPECDHNPYAKGLCRHCYEYARTHKSTLSPENRRRIEERVTEAAKKPRQYHTGLRPETIEKAQMLEGLRQKGLTFKQIRAETGIPDGTACAILKRCQDHLDKMKEV